MDSVNPSPRHSFIQYPKTPQTASANPAILKSAPQSAYQPATPEKTPLYSKIFDDQELERLQNNLESIADMAGKALQRIKK